MTQDLPMKIEWFTIPINSNKTSIKLLREQLGNDFFREGVMSILHENTIAVTFTKKTGGIRKMVCTNNPKHLVSTNTNQTTRPKIKSPSTISVWDIEKQGWRSFILDSIISIEPVDS